MTHISQEEFPVINKFARPVGKVHAFSTVTAAVIHEDVWSLDFTKELIRFPPVSWTLDFNRIEEGEVRVEFLYPQSEAG